MYASCSVEYINQQVGCIVYRCIPTYTYLKLSYIYIYIYIYIYEKYHCSPTVAQIHPERVHRGTNNM